MILGCSLQLVKKRKMQLTEKLVVAGGVIGRHEASAFRN